MLNTNFKRLEEEKVCCGCGALIEKEAPAFTIIQGEQHLNNIEIVLCEDCGNNLQNDMSDDYCMFND